MVSEDHPGAPRGRSLGGGAPGVRRPSGCARILESTVRNKGVARQAGCSGEPWTHERWAEGAAGTRAAAARGRLGFLRALPDLHGVTQTKARPGRPVTSLTPLCFE